MSRGICSTAAVATHGTAVGVEGLHRSVLQGVLVLSDGGLSADHQIAGLAQCLSRLGVVLGQDDHAVQRQVSGAKR